VNSLTILIIGAPAVLAVIAFKKAEEQQPKTVEPPYRDWQFPPKWHPPVAKTGGR
jgi:hypothetical protein